MKKNKPQPKNPQPVKISEDLARAINAVILQARAAGLPSFLFSFKDQGGNPTVHYENIKYADAINLAGFAWMNAIQMELAAHPEYSDEFRSIFEVALKDYVALIKGVNEKVGAYKEKNS